MPKYFCDYCDTYLTHDSPSVRKTHCAGRKHRENVKFYYEKWYEENIKNIQQIPPPSSFATLDFPPPPMLRGPPPPLPSLANVMVPPPSMLPPPHQLPMPNVMIPPPTTTLLPPPTMLPPGMSTILHPPPQMHRDSS